MGSEAEMIFSSSGANCSIVVAMVAPPARRSRPCRAFDRCISSSTLVGCFDRRLFSYQLWRPRSTGAFVRPVYLGLLAVAFWPALRWGDTLCACLDWRRPRYAARYAARRRYAVLWN